MQTLPTSLQNTVEPEACFAVASPTEQQIEKLFRESHYRQIRGIQCEVRDGVAILQGRVRSFYAKQTAQELIRNIDGVNEIQNRVEVV